MSEEAKFLEQVEAFEEVTPERAEELLEERSGQIVFIGRETCPYCRKFANTLSQVAKEHDLKVHFVHAEKPGAAEAIQAFRDKYEVETVPGFLYSDADTPVQVRLDSGMSAEEILEFVNAN